MSRSELKAEITVFVFKIKNMRRIIIACACSLNCNDCSLSHYKNDFVIGDGNVENCLSWSKVQLHSVTLVSLLREWKLK